MWRRAVLGAVAVGALFVAACAEDEESTPSEFDSERVELPLHIPEPTGVRLGADSISEGEVQGHVHDIDLAEGRIDVNVDGEVVELDANPAELADVNPGEVVRISFRAYGGEDWLVSIESAEEWTDGFTHSGRFTGLVQSSDREQGLLVVGGERFRAHPEQLRSLLPGQLVTVEFVEIDGRLWMTGARDVRGDFI